MKSRLLVLTFEKDPGKTFLRGRGVFSNWNVNVENFMPILGGEGGWRMVYLQSV